jgi:hypothetical protein
MSDRSLNCLGMAVSYVARRLPDDETMTADVEIEVIV